jgi:FAD:protein FMN transferase
MTERGAAEPKAVDPNAVDRGAAKLPSAAVFEPPAGGLRRVEQIMGTAIGIDARDAATPPAVLDMVFAFLREVDERFSPYKPDSEVSRLIRGDLDPDSGPERSRDLRDVLGLCEGIRGLTNGFFDIRGHRADGRPDPTGLVKGWSIERAAGILDRAGVADYAINAGGDILTRGEVEPGRRWRIGIRHPQEADRVARVLEVRDLAVATSGLYERGAHIVDPHTGRVPLEMVSVTVVGPSLTYADAFATASFAVGRSGVEWVAGQPGYGAFGITAEGRAVWTPVVDRLLAQG